MHLLRTQRVPYIGQRTFATSHRSIEASDGTPTQIPLPLPHKSKRLTIYLRTSSLLVISARIVLPENHVNERRAAVLQNFRATSGQVYAFLISSGRILAVSADPGEELVAEEFSSSREVAWSVLCLSLLLLLILLGKQSLQLSRYVLNENHFYSV